LRFTGPLGKFTWRMLATVLAGQGIVIFFGALVARAIADAQGQGTATTFLWVGTGLAVLSFAAAGMMRRSFGVTLGWLVQVGTFAAAAIVPLMVGVGLIFTGLWVLCLVQGTRIDEAQARAAEAAPAR
jgi:hypothetical protein